MLSPRGSYGDRVMKIQKSAEDYLETILILSRQNGSVRAVDIANALHFSKPSVSRAMGLLRENGYIHMEKEGWIELTDAGREIAERIYERHRLLSEWLMALGVPEKIATKDACRIEHVISESSFQRLKKTLTEKK